MQNNKILLVRHAKPFLQDNEKRFLGQTDIPLSAEGTSQAEKLAGDLINYRISAVHSSDLLRASQTASVIAGKFSQPVKTERRFREINMGDWEYLTFTEVRSRYADEYEKRGRQIAQYRRPGGESFADLQARALEAFHEIVHKSTGDIVIVAHAGVNRVILCSLLGIPIESIFTIKMEYASAYEIIINENKFTVSGKIIEG